jgi:uncharacterized membrane-anchored protein YitT (DUF2179 family)
MRWTMLAAGAAIYAFGLEYFIVPNRLMEGGVTGIAVLLHYMTGVSTSLAALLLNLPLFWLGWRQLGRKAMLFTIAGTLLLSLFLWIWEQAAVTGVIRPFVAEQELMLVVLYAGVTMGAGLGLVFRAGGTTGGVDILARLIHRRTGWSLGRILLGMDAVILGSSLFVLPQEKVLYTLVSVFVAARVIDFISEGGNAAKSFFIISKEPERLASKIMREMDRGATLFEATGGFTGQPRKVVFCVVHRVETRKLLNLVREHDRRAFFVIGDVYEVWGEGFREHAEDAEDAD